jgi:hypothetical protein
MRLVTAIVRFNDATKPRAAHHAHRQPTAILPMPTPAIGNQSLLSCANITPTTVIAVRKANTSPKPSNSLARIPRLANFIGLDALYSIQNGISQQRDEAKRRKLGPIYSTIYPGTQKAKQKTNKNSARQHAASVILCFGTLSLVN